MRCLSYKCWNPVLNCSHWLSLNVACNSRRPVAPYLLTHPQCELYKVVLDQRFQLVLLLPSDQTSTNRALSTCIFTFPLIAGKKCSAATVSRIIRTNNCNYIWSCFSPARLLKFSPLMTFLVWNGKQVWRWLSCHSWKTLFWFFFSFLSARLLRASLVGFKHDNSKSQRRCSKIKYNPILPNEGLFFFVGMNTKIDRL